MPKSVLTVDLQRPSSNVPWGFLICGGRDQASDNLGLVPSLDVLFQGLTLKIGNVKKLTPASRAGLCKMDYLISVGIRLSHCLLSNSSNLQVNEKPVFNMTHAECCREIKMSGQTLRIECERFEEKTELKRLARVDVS